MLILELRELRAHNLINNLPPQPTRREHIRLIKTPHLGRRLLLQREMRRQPDNALDLRSRVRLRVERVSAAVVFLALAEVDAPRQLAHDVEVHAAADFGFEGGDVYE